MQGEGGGGSSAFCRKLLGINDFGKKLPMFPLFWVLLQFYLQIFQKFAWEGVLFHIPPPTPRVHLRSSDNLSIHEQLTWLICVCSYLRRPKR
jgi:hypothetical protein